MKKFIIASGLILFGFCLLVFLGISTSKAAQKDGGAVKVLSIPSPAFEMPKESLKYVNNGTVYLTEGSEYIRAPLILPNKTKILKVELMCLDNNATKNVRLWIHVINNDNSISTTICNVESTGTGSTYRTFTTTAITPNRLDNTSNFYLINLHLPGTDADNIRLLGVKIWYKGKW